MPCPAKRVNRYHAQLRRLDETDDVDFVRTLMTRRRKILAMARIGATVGPGGVDIPLTGIAVRL
jgi:hypothetical protein